MLSLFLRSYHMCLFCSYTHLLSGCVRRHISIANFVKFLLFSMICSICHDDLETDVYISSAVFEGKKRSVVCGHYYHLACIHEWIQQCEQRPATSPMFRRSIKLKGFDCPFIVPNWELIGSPFDGLRGLVYIYNWLKMSVCFFKSPGL